MNRGSVASFIGRQHAGGPDSQGQQKLLIGPWLHGPQQSRVGDLMYPGSCNWDITASMLTWFNFHLKEIDGLGGGSATVQPTVQYFNMGACEDGAPGNEWRTADDFPLPQVVETAYTLHAGETVNTGIGYRNTFATGRGELGYSGSQSVQSKGMLSTVGESRAAVKPKAADLVHATQWRSGAPLRKLLPVVW
jgi:predicted acyl esterase